MKHLYSILVLGLLLGCTQTVGSKSASTSLSSSDFTIDYNGLTVDFETPVNELVEYYNFPSDFEENNRGLISENGHYKRWNLSYPFFAETDIRFVIFSKKDSTNDWTNESSYLVGYDLESTPTARGIISGDSESMLINTYGLPTEQEGEYFFYEKDGSKIRFTVRDGIVEDIFIDYRVDKSVEDQVSVN